METPICDFVRRYQAQDVTRMHMPGHKGVPLTGNESADITEIAGADVLYDAHGIIRESEENAALLFGSARTVYSAEGSSLCIRAMLYLTKMYAKLQGRKARVAAGRNAHRVFLESAALLDLEISWIGTGEELLCTEITPEELEAVFSSKETAPCAVFVTSPDYLGHCAKLDTLSSICHRHGALLLVDHAHGAYRKFLRESRHPLDSGADLCCDSAHKSLPVLTGGAYLHASGECPEQLIPMMERAMALFASTSPSWLILQSLDAGNALLEGGYPIRIRETAKKLDELKQVLKEKGWELTGDEELKLTLCPKEKGWTGTELASYLTDRGMVPEFADPDHLVLMITPETDEEELTALKKALLNLPRRQPNETRPPKAGRRQQALSAKEAMFEPFERISAEKCLGRILASPSVSCPPAVPICICGERIDENALQLFRYYAIDKCDVVIER